MMTYAVINCPECGGDHFGSYKCPFIKAPCCVCKDPTIFACSDCAIDSGGKASVHVCGKAECRHEHEFWQHRVRHPDTEAAGQS